MCCGAGGRTGSSGRPHQTPARSPRSRPGCGAGCRPRSSPWTPHRSYPSAPAPPWRVPLAPELDYAALIGWPAAEEYLNFAGHPTTVYTRSVDSAVEAVRAVLGPTANPEAPHEVTVSRPSDALAAQRAAGSAFTGLLLGLGAVALLVGGVGVANTMVISVLERRSEIGLRRSLGATRGQIRLQFLAESLLLSALGGVVGVGVGAVVTAAYAAYQGWPATVPAWVAVGGVNATMLIGALAGLYPAVRAARVSPTEALATA